jgi:hypothetical protein
LNEGQHSRISTHIGLANLDDIVRAEVLGEHTANLYKSNEMQEDDEKWKIKTLIDKKPVSSNQKPVSEKKQSSPPIEGKKGGKMIIASKTLDPVDDNMLTTVEVSGSEENRDSLRELIRRYSDKKLSLLELDYQP